MRASTSGSAGPALLALLRRTAAACSRQHQQQQQVATISSSIPLLLPQLAHPPRGGAAGGFLRPADPLNTSASPSTPAPQPLDLARRLYAKKAAKGGKGGAAAGGKAASAAVSASPDDPDAAPPPPRVRPPFVAAARRRRLAQMRPLPRAAREALAALAALAPASAEDQQQLQRGQAAASAASLSGGGGGGGGGSKQRPHLLRDVAWPLDQQDALVLLHDATLGDVTGPGHTLLVPHVSRDVLQSAAGAAAFVKECLQDGVDFALVEQFFVQTLAAQGQDQAAEEAGRALEAAERAARRAAEERQQQQQQQQGEGDASASSSSSSSSPSPPASSKTGITDLPDRPFRPPRLLVRGMRIQIKGRLSGKGGKAAKKAWSWGATSAATFSDAVDFAQAQAGTRAGAVGVKVWLVFREDAFDREKYALLRRRARDPDTGRPLWRGPGWAADAAEELALAARSGASRATGLAGASVRRPETAWWSSEAE